MKYLKRFNESSGQSLEEIRKICEKYDIRNWSLNEEGLVDVDHFVDLRNQKLAELPLKFGRVAGVFFCNFNNLTTLDGAPEQVGDDFYCYENKLTSLEGGPKEVGGDFYCYENKLTS
ncbi:hypothetical protein EBU71_21275, partial [bacterium]|nr:hypothetical protein [Candidatus Elulimicrobium humile]